MKLTFNFTNLAFLAAIILCTNAAQQQSCTEECPSGFERVSGLDHCYKLMLRLGPVSHNKAMAACGYEGGATVVTFDNPGDEQILRNFLWDNYNEALKADLAYLTDGGFWTGYVRKYGPSSNPFMNVYSGSEVPSSYFTPGQPDNLLLGEYGQENCLARKRFYRESVKWSDVGATINGLDDYTCGFPHWVVCMHRDLYALNQQGYNTALMNNTVTLPPNGMCKLDWVNQNMYQLYMMRAKRLASNNGNPKQKDIDLGNSYLAKLQTIRSPTCPSK
ncbi:uncharacterized protein LOC142351606 [Convolutriloba macropyga]|uniref:uncharacterized protein LOC142351606 n=1 Tax=Convolutriloba macropyga TaxID=536237 RepID=UPI003F5245AC